MSIQANVFHPVLNNVLTTIKDSIIVEVGDGEGNKVNLFFMQNSVSAVEILGRTPLIPAEQVTNFVSKLLHDAGFDFFEYERIEYGHSVGEVRYGHPAKGEATPIGAVADSGYFVYSNTN